MFRCKVKALSDVVVIPFFECYPAACLFCDLRKRIRGSVGFLKAPMWFFERHLRKDDIALVAELEADNYIFLGGEPTISKVFPSLLETLRDRSNGRIIVYTNGFVMGKYIKAFGVDRKVRNFLELVDSLVVSMEGVREYNDAVRGLESSECALTVVEKCSDLTEVKVRIGFSEISLKYVTPLVDELDEKGVPSNLFPRIGSRYPLRRETAERLYWYAIEKRNAWILLPSFSNFVSATLGVEGGKPCPAGWLKLCVWPDGKITPCQWLDYPICTLKCDLEDVERWANGWVEGAFSRIPEECSNCRYVETCRGGCRAIRDHTFCPLVEEGVEEVREAAEVKFERKEIRAKVERINEIVHGCSAGC